MNRIRFFAIAVSVPFPRGAATRAVHRPSRGAEPTLNRGGPARSADRSHVPDPCLARKVDNALGWRLGFGLAATAASLLCEWRAEGDLPGTGGGSAPPSSPSRSRRPPSPSP